jgi:hexosaminidase
MLPAMRRLTVVFLTLGFCVPKIVATAAGAREEVALIPQPVRVERRVGAFELTAKTVIVADTPAVLEGRRLAARLRSLTGLDLRLARRTPSRNYIRLNLEKGLPSQLGPEGYVLSVTPKRVLLGAGGEAGLFYGGVTLTQLLPATTPEARGKAARYLLRCGEIEDYPRFPWRGLLLDVARHYLPPEAIKRFVDVMALHKFNTLQLHLTDDQGWRLQIRQYPRLTQVGSVRKESPRPGAPAQGDGTPYGPFFYTQDQVRDLVAFAQSRHVTLVPEIEMPGHFLAALAAYPEYSCRGGPFEVRTRWGVEPDILCPGQDAAVAFAKDILDEVTDLFPSRFIHIGGDEAPRDRWKECPRCRTRIRAEGLQNEAQLQTWFNRQIEDFLASRGRRLIGWDEILEGGLTPGAAVMSWRGMEGGLAAAQAGHDVVMSPTSHCYFDYAQAQGPAEPESIGGLIPLATVYAFEPVPSTLPAAQQRHVLGAQGNLWSEFLRSLADVEYFAYPRAVALAEVVWSPAAERNFDDFQRRLRKHLARLDSLRVNYRRLDHAGRP